MKYIYMMNEDALRRDEEFGGKAGNLRRLVSKNMNVPPFIVISPAVFGGFLGQNNIGRNKDGADMRKKIIGGSLPDDFCLELKKALKKAKLDDEYLAVRSSAVGEDSAEASFAGQMDTFLFVKGFEDVKEAIKKCWASLYSERIGAYRREKNISDGGLATSVVVQKMIRSEISCVIFTCDAINGNDDVVINAVFGQGEGLVSGKIEADTYTVARTGGLKNEIIAEKRSKVDFAEGGGTRILALPADFEKKKCLDDKTLAALVGEALKIEKNMGAPQDIEIGIEKGMIYVLQTRPITRTKPDNRIIWDNSNITESYAGVTTPFTFSFILDLYNIVYQQFTRAVGVPESQILENEEVFRNMLGLINGEVYYNLRSWYRVIMMLPGYEQNKKFMEQMMGVKERFDERPGGAGGGPFEKFTGNLKVAAIGLRFLWHFMRIDSRVRQFKENFILIYRRYKEMDFGKERPWEIMGHFNFLRQKLVWNWQAPILTDFFAMVFYGLLKNMVIKWGIDGSGTMQNDLLCGQGDVESTLPVKDAMKIADLIKTKPEYLEIFAEKDNKKIMDSLNKPEYAEVGARVGEYLDNYGFRGVNELKIEEPSLSDRPEFLIGIIRNYLSLKDGGIEEMKKHEKEMKEEAEKKALDAIRAKGLVLYPFRKRIFYYVLKNALKHIKNRESMRFARSKVYNVARRMSQALGKQFAGAGLIGEWRDIYYLDINEVFAYIKGTSLTQDLKALSLLRKKEFEGFKEKNSLKDRIETRGIVYKDNDFSRVKAAGTEGLLKGVACSPGKVKGRVKIILDPQGDIALNGEILVTKRTDPGWVTFYPSVSGLIIEKGSILSHSAIVAREMGLPTVVGITGLLEAVKDGMMVEVDGNAGTVKIFREGE